VRTGMAWWNPQHTSLQSTQERADFQQAEFNAKIRRFGLWNSKNPVPPWQWRFP
nr:thermonuclease family protein [Propionivibrio sp.]